MDIGYGTTRKGSLFREHARPDNKSTPTGATTGVSIPEMCIDSDGYSCELRDLIDFLQTSTGYKAYMLAYRDNMLYKVTKYADLHKSAEEDVSKQMHMIDIKRPELKRVAKVEGDSDNWLIFESISEQYHEAKNRAATFEYLKLRAQQRLNESASDSLAKDRDSLVDALKNLTDFTSQAHVVGKAVDIVSSFIKDPRLFRTKPMNFMLLGGAGTGKTTLASAIGDVFAKAGIFVGNSLVEAGRAELVGQYEGQTVARTRNFLTNNLDNGVIFIDEAYAITPWQNGKPEGYGAEAATAMVEFMTRYTGLYCIIVAGYERQMVRYFLPTNEGLSRRFPNKYVLKDMSARDLVAVFKTSLLKAQGLQVPNGKQAFLESSNYFTTEAWKYLHNLIHTCTRGSVSYTEEFDAATQKTYRRVRSFTPTWECMYSIFEHQAGSMSNLADEAITVLMGTITYQQVVYAQRKNGGERTRLPIAKQSKEVMRNVVVNMVLKTCFTDVEQCLSQLNLVESII